ncbi:MAG: DUF3426 domain-containing protein [Thiomonas sp.]
MSLATRCPHCGTAFKLVRDQLLLRQGWVRCGRCGEAFNAADHAFEHAFERPHAVPASPGPELAAELQPTAPSPSPSPTPTPTPTPAEAEAEAEALPSAESAETVVSPAAAAQPSIDAAYHAAITAALPAQAIPVRPGMEITSRSPWQSGAFAYSVPVPAFFVSADPARPDTDDQTPLPQAAPQASEHETVAEPPAIPEDLIQTEQDEEDGQQQIEAAAEESLELPATPDPDDAAWAEHEAFPAIERTQTPSSTAALDAASEAGAVPDHPGEIEGSDDEELASFSAEAEAALRNNGTAAGAPPPPAPFEELLRAAKEEALLAEADRAPEAARHGARFELEPLADKTDAQAAAGAGETDSRFDLGAALHYEFGPDTGAGTEIGAETREPEPTLDAVTPHADGAAAAQPFMSDALASAAPNLLDGVVTEPGFLRQARAQERWQQPGVRAGLAVVAMLLIVMGGAQAAWTWRDALAANWPQTRPVLVRLCAVAGCSLTAPRRPRSLVIDTSSMSPGSDGLLQLDASLRNRSGEAVAYPALELTLTGTQDQIVVRKVIQPAQYLATGKLANDAAALQQRVQRGLAADAELRIQLKLQLRKDEASGYTLYAFYP